MWLEYFTIVYNTVEAALSILFGALAGSIALVGFGLACSFLSVALLFGLGFNYLFGWWFADAIAGIFIVLFLFHEGMESWREVEAAPGH